jgi:hypothetical protein
MKIKKIEPFEFDIKKIILTIFCGIIGLLIIKSINLQKLVKIPEIEALAFTIMAYIIFVAAFFEKQKDGKIPRKSKNAALLTNAFAFGLSLGCLIFVPGITWSIFSLILMIITALSATSLYFVTEGVSDY